MAAVPSPVPVAAKSSEALLPLLLVSRRNSLVANVLVDEPRLGAPLPTAGAREKGESGLERVKNTQSMTLGGQ